MTDKSFAEKLTPTEREIVDRVDSRIEDAIGFLEKIVNINSGTMNHPGVREVGRVFEAELLQLGFDCRWIPMHEVNRSGHLFAELEGSRGKRLLLIGHLDTVFERDSSFQRFQREGRIARGPGVEDMKGGDAVMLYALKAIHAARALDGARIIVSLIGDEEDSGEPLAVTRRDLLEAAQRSDVALGFETCGVDHHRVTMARRGYSEWRLAASGKRGHSSRIFSTDFGAGAIYEMSRILHEFYVQLGSEPDLTLGPGIILGGTNVSYDAAHSRGKAFGKANVIPQSVMAVGDLRFLTVRQREQAKDKMRRIIEASLPLTAAEITFRDTYPPMPPRPGNYDLMDQLDRVSRDLGFGPLEAFDPGERGAADISFAAEYAEACLDGLGPAGDGGHSKEEMIDLSSLHILIKRAALLMHRLSRGRAARTQSENANHDETTSSPGVCADGE